MHQQRVLAVDDDPRYLRLLRVNLEAAGYQFAGAGSAAQALDLLAGTPVDLLLLDVRMAEMDGFALLERLREFSDVPVIFVTALGEEADRVRGLKLGADDYLTKPFSAPELLARVEAVLRRYRGDRVEAQVNVGALRIDLAQRRVFRGAMEVPLSRTEFRLLTCLARHLGKVVPQDQLVREVWGPLYDETYEGLRVYVYRLRHKLEVDPDHPEYLATFPGVGYMLQSPAPKGRGRGAGLSPAAPAAAAARLLLAVWAALALLAAALPAAPAAADALDQEVIAVGRLLRCPVCQSVSVADSTSELAAQMRQVIREQLQQGKTRQQIIAYFVERYGESVLFDPPKRGFALLAWVVTPLAMLAGGAIIWRTVRRRAAGAVLPAAAAGTSPAGAEDLDQYRARLRAELAEDDPTFAVSAGRVER